MWPWRPPRILSRACAGVELLVRPTWPDCCTTSVCYSAAAKCVAGSFRLWSGSKSRAPTPDVERQVYAFDHAQLGAFVAKSWEFPDAVVDAIGHHHEVDRYTGRHRELVYVVATANYFCSRAGWTSMGVHNVALPSDDTYRVLGLDQVALAIIWDELSPTLEKASYLANV